MKRLPTKNTHTDKNTPHKTHAGEKAPPKTHAGEKASPWNTHGWKGSPKTHTHTDEKAPPETPTRRWKGSPLKCTRRWKGSPWKPGRWSCNLPYWEGPYLGATPGSRTFINYTSISQKKKVWDLFAYGGMGRTHCFMPFSFALWNLQLIHQ